MLRALDSPPLNDLTHKVPRTLCSVNRSRDYAFFTPSTTVIPTGPSPSRSPRSRRQGRERAKRDRRGCPGPGVPPVIPTTLTIVPAQAGIQRAPGAGVIVPFAKPKKTDDRDASERSEIAGDARSRVCSSSFPRGLPSRRRGAGIQKGPAVLKSQPIIKNHHNHSSKTHPPNTCIDNTSVLI